MMASGNSHTESVTNTTSTANKNNNNNNNNINIINTSSSSSKPSLRLSHSLSIKLTPLKLSKDIKALSNTAQIPSFELYNHNNSNNNSSNYLSNNTSNSKSHSSSYTSLQNLIELPLTNKNDDNQNQNRKLKISESSPYYSNNSNNNTKMIENEGHIFFTPSIINNPNKISSQVGTTNKLTDLNNIDKTSQIYENFKNSFTKTKHTPLHKTTSLSSASYLTAKSNLSQTYSNTNISTNNHLNDSNSNHMSTNNIIDNSPSSILLYNLNQNYNNYNNNKNNNNNTTTTPVIFRSDTLNEHIKIDLDADNEDNSNSNCNTSNYDNDDSLVNLTGQTDTTDRSDELLNKSDKKKTKRSALAWVGKTVGRRVAKKPNTHYPHYHHHHHANRKHHSPSSSSHNDKTSSTTTSVIKSQSNRNSCKKSNKIDWTESSKQGVHVWSDVSSTQSNESCYLCEPDALEFHKLGFSAKCASQSKNVAKKKCNNCKIIVHETCIDTLQHNVKCRLTFREATNTKKSFRDKETTSTSSSNSLNVNSHHWLCRKYNEEKIETKCQYCTKSYTNRFGLQTSRSIVSCSWCKVSYHLKCFSSDLIKAECNFGEHNQLIVPPSWIVKSSNNKNSFRSSFLQKYHRSSKRHYQQDQSHNNQLSESNNLLLPANNHLQANSRHPTSVFIIRPPSSSNNQKLMKPLLVLINPKSGGKQGPKLLKKFTWLLNPRQVFDLTLPGCPKLPNVPNLRILVGGGDGTVGWVLSVIDQIKFLASPPSVAVLPLGTGNDLARALNWGSGYTDEPLTKILSKVLDSRTIKLDRWKITTHPLPGIDINELDNSENAVDKLKNDVMNNYFSIGGDAHICLEFHERREANPQKFSSRWINLLQYAEAGTKDIIKKTWKDLKDFIKLECDDKDYTNTIRSRGYHCIIFLNIPSYCGGTNPWGSSSTQLQAIDDNRLEVIGCFTSTLAKFQLGGNGERICQAKNIKITTSNYIPIQIDGEPAKLCPSIIEITHKNQAPMLEHVKNNTDSPIIGYHVNTHRCYEVKCILKEDYDMYLKNYEVLKEKALYFGKISTNQLTDSLSLMRKTINVLTTNCANGFYTANWTFLHGEEFFRVSDDSVECLLDIVSNDDIVYILDNTPNNTCQISNDNSISKQGFLAESSPKLEETIEDSTDDDYNSDLKNNSQTSNQTQF